jgi:pimeloyl-ACP methyl ester carboxylesterase
VARVRGIEMTFSDGGRDDHASVVLLHGFPFNHTMWREQSEALRATHRVVAPDLRGHGGTQVVSGPATMEEMARDVAALLDELRLSRVVLGGLSMGGYVALAFARLFPERVRALILADTRPQGDTEEGKRMREETAERALREGMRPVADAMLPKLLAPETIERRPQVAAHVRQMIMETEPAGAAAALRGMAVRHDQTEFLRAIVAPTLIIVGSVDVLTPPADAELMQREIHAARLAVIEGAGHVSNLEQPAEFNRALEGFLRALGP